jgi:hypothetical protein
MLNIPYVGHIGPLIILVVAIVVAVVALRQWVLPAFRRVTRPDRRQ